MRLSVSIALVFLGLACGSDEQAGEAPAGRGEEAGAEVGPGAVDDARLADAEAESWLSHGRTWSEQRFSPLAEIDDSNVSGLELRWSYDTKSQRGLEATPLVVDGVMYATSTWSVVFALDARTGEELWRWDPQVPRAVGQKACCDVVNRGVAVYGGKVYVGTLDGRLVALDAARGVPLWQAVTVDQGKSYTITGAPRVFDGKVLIGNGGAEFGVRGYVSAYDAESGVLLWRTFTVPGNPADGFESEAMEGAAKTWQGTWWELGGGGTVWDSMAYDPELGLLYVGTGNGSPWVRELRSPGGGDNLFLSSILALDPDDGKIVWHYQTSPGDNWDYTATQHMILAELPIDGKARKVLMQAPKNGFFYVLDRETGKLISAEPYAEVSWAERVDPKTGRPVEIESQIYEQGLRLVKPSPFGAHNWQPMSFHPETGLVYIPAQEVLGAYRREPAFRPQQGETNTGTDMHVFATLVPEVVDGRLLAWDPVAQREAWRVPLGLPWNGGTLATAGNLVFQGTADGRFVAYAADTGRTLWVAHTGSGVIAAPISYAIDGVQYVSVLAGWGGAFGLAGGPAALGAVKGPGRLLTWALPAALPTPEQVEAQLTQPGELVEGQRLYHVWCSRCHGGSAVASGGVPDLREAVVRLGENFDAVALHGLPGTGMPDMGRYIVPEQAALIRRYIETRAEASD